MALLATMGLLLINAPKSHKINCKPVQELFYHYLGQATVEKLQGIEGAAVKDQSEAIKIVLTTPYCFPQPLIELAQQSSSN